MNKSYRSIWNHALGAWVAVSEIARARGKPARRATSAAWAASALLAVIGLLAPTARAQVIDYADGDDNGAAIITTAPAGVTLNNLGSGAATQSGDISGTGAVIKTGAGLLALTAVNTYAGGTTVSAGILQVVGDSSLGSGDLTLDNNATLQLAGASGLGLTFRPIQLGAGGGTIDVNDTTGTTLAGGISGSGRLTLINSGTDTSQALRLSLSVGGDYTGGTRIGGNPNGRLNVHTNNVDAFGSGPVDIYENAELLFIGGAASAGNLVIATRASLNTAGSDSGVLFESGATAGSATITTEVAGGYVVFADAGTTAGSATINNTNGRVAFRDGTFGGTATIRNNSGAVTVEGDVDLTGTTIENGTGGRVYVDLSTGTSIGSLSGAGNVVLGAQTLSVGALNRDETIGGVISDTGTGVRDQFGTVIHPDVTDTGGALFKLGTGTLTLTGANSYTGVTIVSSGTLRAGAANTLSPGSAHSVAAGATLDLAGHSQRVAALDNGGTVSLLSATPGSTLTVTGAYVGNGGVLRLGTALGASGPSDRLVLDGPGASASGNTAVQITNVGGLGGATVGNGIEVIGALNGATTTAQTTRDAFSLAGGHVDAGAFEYRLFAADAAGAGESWYLRTALIAAPPARAPAPAPVPGQPAATPAPAPTAALALSLAALPTFRVEVPLLAALPAQLRQADVSMLANLHRRTGDDDASAQALASLGPMPTRLSSERRAWARLVYTDLDIRQGGTVSPASQGSLQGVQAGTDLFTSATGQWRAGVYVGSQEGRVDVSGFASGLLRAVGETDLRARYLGAYASYENATGFYADAVLQYGTHRYRASALGAAPVSGKGNSLTASLEVGQAFSLGGGWALEPQAQLIYRRARLDDVALSRALVRQHDADGWIAGLGLRLKGDFATSAGRLQPYARVGVQHGGSGTDLASFIGPAAATDIGSSANYTSAELAGGFTLSMNRTVSLYGEVGKQFATGGSARIKSALQGALGVRVKW